jgi:hypothetical protein
MSTRPSLTPLADLGRLARQAPLHRHDAAGIAAAGDDAEVGARLRAAIRAASTGRTDRTRPMLHQRKKVLVNQAPSTRASAGRFCCDATAPLT